MNSRLLHTAICALSLALLVVFSSAGDAWCKRIVFFTSTSGDNTYWPQVYRVLEAVARDLGIELDIYEFDVNNRFAKHVEGVKILNSAPKPDGAIFSVAIGNSEPLLQAAEDLKIPVFLQGPLFPMELPKIGGFPRKKFKMWIGYFYQDEFEKGYLLGRSLLERAHSINLLGENGKIHVAGVGGDVTWFGSALREDGLVKAVGEDEQAVMLQVVPTKWTEKEATEKTSHLLNRYQDLQVVWAASDQLGIGVARAFAQTGKKAGEDALTGGLDLSRNGLLHIQAGDLTATVASTMLQYAEVVIYMFDYLHGIDFVEDVAATISSPLHVVTRDNVKQYLRLLESFEDIDYAAYSKFLNPSLESYDFSIDKILSSGTAHP